MKLRLPILFILLICAACEDVTDRKLNSQELAAVVVEGVMTSEEINHRIHLSRPYQYQNETGVPITGAVVTLAADNTVIGLVEYPQGSGDYYTPVIKAVTNKTYTLSVTADGQTYTASDSAPAAEPLDPFQYDKSDGLYTITFSASGSAANYIRYSLDWSSTDECTAGTGCDAEQFYYDLKTTDVNEIFKPDSEIVRFPAGTTVIRKKYSVSDSYRNFLRSMLSETEWHGGTFDVQPGQVNTNFSNGALGFFAVSTVVGDTLVVVAK